ncbi:MAG: glycosyltransferase [Chloroflexi bacterium]|nr:glycosyltransferase [Chloroflexota bacterium]
MRKLWEDHVTWTRLYIVSAVAGLPDQGATAERLLKNQEDIGDAIRPYYGDEAGDALTELLKEHILVAAELIDAAKAGDSAAFDDTNARWYANADEIAAFLNSANPENWPLDEMQAMMRDHLDLTLQEASARLNGDYEADIAAYEEIHLQILHMADMLSEGIINQFPKEFRK